MTTPHWFRLTDTWLLPEHLAHTVQRVQATSYQARMPSITFARVRNLLHRCFVQLQVPSEVGYRRRGQGPILGHTPLIISPDLQMLCIVSVMTIKRNVSYLSLLIFCQKVDILL